MAVFLLCLANAFPLRTFAWDHSSPLLCMTLVLLLLMILFLLLSNFYSFFLHVSFRHFLYGDMQLYRLLQCLVLYFTQLQAHIQSFFPPAPTKESCTPLVFKP